MQTPSTSGSRDRLYDDENRYIRHLAANFVEYLKDLQNQGQSTSSEMLVARLETDIGNCLSDKQYPSDPKNGARLTYQDLYASMRHDSEESITAALYAAELEHRAHSRLSTTQTEALGRAFEQVGGALLKISRPQLAVFALGRASRLYLYMNDHGANTRCQYLHAQARRKSHTRVIKKCWDTALWATAGYGFRPWRLQYLIALQLLIFGAIHNAITHDRLVDSLFLAITNYIDPSIGSKLTMESAILTFDGYAGILTNSIFFALLVRHWFRV